MELNPTTHARGTIKAQAQEVAVGEKLNHPEYGEVEVVAFDGRVGDLKTDDGSIIPVGAVQLNILKKA